MPPAPAHTTPNRPAPIWCRAVFFFSRAGARVRPLACTHIRAAAGAYAHSRAAAGQLVEQAIHVGI